MKKNLFFSSLLSLFLLIGAGCNLGPSPITQEPTTTAQPTTSPTQEEQESQTVFEDSTNEEELTLYTEMLGNGAVKFRWKVNEELAKEAEWYRLVQGKKPNPSWPATQWYQRGPSHREYVWNNLPLGTQHFRLCVVVNNECTVYSENKEVEVK